MWNPIHLGAMRHILEKTTGQAAPDDRVVRVARGVWMRADAVFHFSAKARHFDHSSVLVTTQSALRIRGRELDAPPVVHLGFLLSGQCDFGPERGSSRSWAPAGLFVVPDRGSFDLTALEPTRILHLRIEEERLRERGVRAAALRYREGESPSLATPLRSLGLAVVDAAWKPSDTAATVAERALEDLMVGVFLEASGYAMDGADLRAGVRARAIRYIADHHRDVELTPRAVAATLGISIRHLQRAFEDHDRSIAAEIAGRRVETAALLLRAPGTSALTINQLATASGFSSAFELRASFRARFGVLPSEYRSLAEPEARISAQM